MEFEFLTQSGHFEWAIAFAWWLIFKMVSFLEYLVFVLAVFCLKRLKTICRMDFDMFWQWGFFMGYSFCMVDDFQNDLYSGIIFCFLEGSFVQNNSKWLVEWILTCFLEFYFFSQSEDFAWAIAFAWFPISKMVSFLEYLVFFGAVFLPRTTLNDW